MWSLKVTESPPIFPTRRHGTHWRHGQQEGLLKTLLVPLTLGGEDGLHAALLPRPPLRSLIQLWLQVAEYMLLQPSLGGWKRRFAAGVPQLGPVERSFFLS